jgi:NADPH-dependent 2,4-dienoyl-CoA reductase/sulfur reductase-like enzyme
MRDHESFDLAVIGAGPAGMSAAATAAEQGLRVALIDAGRQLGGQYFRHPAPGLTAPWLPKLYHGWEQFEDLVTRVETTSGIEVLFDHQVWAIEVWAIEPGFRVLTDRGPIQAPYVLLATGACERVVPFPGWDLPGVVTAGGAQALLKGNLVLPGRHVVVAGTGPLLLPVAAALATAGAEVLGLYEANPIRGYAKNPLPLLTNPSKLTEGLDYARQFARARIPVRTHRMVISAEGTDAVEAVVVARPDGSDPERIECDTLAISYGLTPQIDLALTLGAEPQHLADGTTALRVNTTQRTTVPGLYAAGETAGVAGAETALVEGEIAALAIARAYHSRGLPPAVASKPNGRRVTRAITAARSRLSRSDDATTPSSTTDTPPDAPPAAPSPLPPPPNLATLLRSRARQRAFAELLRARHPIPAAWHTHLADDTLVCRCEEVPVSAITEAVTDLGATDARTVKLLTRAGMGWCQGRMCGYAIACLAGETPPTETDLLAAAKRPLARPVPLSVLAEQDRRNK